MPDVLRTPLLTTQEAAAFVGLSPRTLETLRVKGKGPEYVKLGRAVRYDCAALQEWIDANRTRSTSARCD